MNIIDKATRSVNQKPQPYRALVTILIVLGGDIETNPGPSKYPCKICNKPVARTHRALQCDECDQWVHIKCGDISPIEYENLGKSSAAWICHVCGFPNFSTSFGSTESILRTENSFSALSDEEKTHLTPLTTLKVVMILAAHLTQRLQKNQALDNQNKSLNSKD